MSVPERQPARDSKLWQRILLVGLTGTLPLFSVSLILIHIAYSRAIEFGLNEQRGIAFQRPLQRLLEVLPRYQLAARQALAAGTPDRLALSTAESQADDAMSRVESEYTGELGHALQFSDTELLSRNRDNARLVVLERAWSELKRASLSVVAAGQGTSRLTESVRAMIRHAGDRSNLILDDDLDSFYLMDITLCALPQTEERIAAITTRVADWLETGQARAHTAEIAVFSAMLREADLERIARDAQTALSEDAHFNGVSASLAVNLPPAIARFKWNEQQLLSLLDRVLAGQSIAAQEFEGVGWSAHAESFRLFRVAADELDRLLAIRVRAIRDKRLRAYLTIVLTLAFAGLVMGLITRGLLAARYAEILRSQDELRAKETQLRALGDNLPGGMMYQIMRDFDGTMRFLYVSAGIERLTGVSAEAALADSSALYRQILAEDAPTFREAERDSLVHKRAFKIVVRTRHADGSERWMEFASAPRLLADGRPVWDGIQMDVTERRQAEAATKQSEVRFYSIFDHSPIPITLAGFADGKMIAANDSFLKFSGLGREEVIGRTTLELGIYPDPSQRSAVIEQLRLHGHVHGREQAFRTKSGEVRHTLLWVNVITISGEDFVLAIALDVTEQKLAAQQQKELEEQLRQAQKLEALGTLAGGIAHDFNNILGAIISYSELSVLENPDNDTLRENLNEVLKASARATTLVRQILSFSRQQKEERQDLQLSPIVREALSLLRATLPSTIALEQRLDRVLPDVLANATQVHQIVMNLCTNAAYAMKGKQGQLSVELCKLSVPASGARTHVELSPGDYVRLTIADTGHGMDSATSKRIFEPFFTTKGSGEGTGLGLSVVHGIVKEYGGVVTVDSEVGRGTRLAVYFPARSTTEKQAPAPALEIPRGNGERVLFVDDEAVLGDAASKMLERLGYQSVVFQRSEAAWAAFQQAPQGYDVLVTDLTMPVLTGIDLARQVLALRPGLPIILASGSSGQLTADELDEMGIRELVKKPLDYRTLALALRRVLGA